MTRVMRYFKERASQNKYQRLKMVTFNREKLQ